MRPYIHSRGSIHKLLWVTDCSVGKHAQNSVPEDVSFFQWYYVLAADYFETSPQHKSIYKNVSVTGKCTGLDSDPLVQAILVQQRDFGHPMIDGKASVVHGSGFVDAKAFFVLRLGARFAVYVSYALAEARSHTELSAAHRSSESRSRSAAVGALIESAF